MISSVKRTFVRLLAVCVTCAALSPAAHAAMVSTEQAHAASAPQQQRARINALLNRPEAVAELERLGINRDDAQARVAALSDTEAAALAERIDSMPAGGDFFAVVGIVVVVLVVTDLLGVTDVFPFIRPVR